MRGFLGDLQGGEKQKAAGPSCPVPHVGGGASCLEGFASHQGHSSTSRGLGSGNSSILGPPWNVRRAQLCSPGDKLGRGWV